jgi:hypothetical protein
MGRKWDAQDESGAIYEIARGGISLADGSVFFNTPVLASIDTDGPNIFINDLVYNDTEHFSLDSYDPDIRAYVKHIAGTVFLLSIRRRIHAVDKCWYTGKDRRQRECAHGSVCSVSGKCVKYNPKQHTHQMWIQGSLGYEQYVRGSQPALRKLYRKFNPDLGNESDSRIEAYRDLAPVQLHD